ncbi:hypothetical protein MRB53_030695 [Persea americana]|uniref:Uncharacterized protein n=1 Tax=Persea americana TaxID=3435 RepID=A0ACC2KLX3_PERAE|nr:hypothetical protein MRB53_030695 [Persea americana]|eukprot:TRINITY_DN13668_c2_g1_i1.p1 TRINITY_DN13668_c2_g1~~TRINITY_DN13668_c2_g1_i1.p1  ORF type:complete len:121 (+),score=19.96 TRINITY_DN13668_c2_g1_i1:797-1159(+)
MRNGASPSQLALTPSFPTQISQPAAPVLLQVEDSLPQSSSQAVIIPKPSSTSLFQVGDFPPLSSSQAAISPNRALPSSLNHQDKVFMASRTLDLVTRFKSPAQLLTTPQSSTSGLGLLST